MTFQEKLQLLQRLHHLIRRKATGSPLELTRRLSVSRAALFRYLDILKSFGAPVYYCSDRQSYCYEHEFELIF